MFIFKKYFCLVLLAISAACSAEPVSIHIQMINIADALRLAAGYAHVNIIVSAEVHGSMSLNFTHAEPIVVLNSILNSQQLIKSVRNDVWYIAPRGAMIKSLQEEAKWQTDAEAAAPLLSQTWKIRYARVNDIAALIQNNDGGLLSERGHLSADMRTNQLFIRDTSARLSIIQRLIQRADIPVKQVLVEARLVSMDEDAERLLGVDFSVRQQEKSNTKSVKTVNRVEQQGKYSVAIARLPDGSELDVKLAALERAGRAELISSPSLFTGSQQEASIEAGEEVPYQEVSESGGTAVAFKKAVLGLKVIPQILPGGKVLLELKINQDRPAARMVQGVPAISTRQIVTNVTVKNGQTIVLGGIYERNHEESREGLPFLGNIPIIGLLFSEHNKRDQKRELLIFVTPKILPQAI